ncbi:MAG: HAMP domain-containing histidine kinase [Bacteroidetes bacterium]|nr:HAMP domain-containing histidine kinase [Bacteroidota bacterium]
MVDESARIKELEFYEILDTGEEEGFNELVSLASAICGTPISLVSLIDEHRQWFKARIGLEITETPKELAFCKHAIEGEGLFVVQNALQDDRFKNNPLVTGDPNIRFYAGMPVTSPNGYNLGTLCVIDRIPRELTEQQKFALQVLANQVMRQIENRKYLKKIEEQNLELNRINKQKDKLFGIVAHDLRSPLIGITSLVEAYISGDLTEQEIEPYFKKLFHNLEHSIEMMDNLLNWTRTQLKTDRLKPERIDFSELLSGIVRNLEKALDRKCIQLKVDCQNSTAIFADKSSVEMIFRNLIHNAIKFSNRNSSIEINCQTSDSGKFLVVEVIDFGIGMDKALVDELFTETGPKSSYGTEGEKGTGLGFILIREYLQKNHGKIEVFSEPGKGTRFVVQLPIAD